MLNITARQDLMKTIVDILSVLVEEARFKMEDGRLEVRVVDPSHVAMIRMDVDASAFEAFEVESTDIGLELNKLRDLLSLAGAGDLLEMTFDDAVGQLNIQMGNIHYVLRPLDKAVMPEPRVPPVDLDAKVSLASPDFSQALRAASKIGDLVTLSLDSQEFTVSVAGDTDRVNVTYQAGELLELVCDGSVSSQYSLQYLQPLVKRIEGTVERIDLFFGENKPLKLEFEFAEGAGKCIYFLAPRVEGDA
jgi:proliferating cell nuclear antigen